MVRRSVLIALLVAALSGCGNELPPQTTTYTYPAENAVLDFDVASAGDTLHVVWIEDQTDHFQALHSSSDDGGSSWSEPVPVQTGQSPPDSGHDEGNIRVTATGKILVVAWQAHDSDDQGRSPLVIARSNDGGRQWAAVLASDAVNSSRSEGHFDLSATPGGRFHLAWPDLHNGQQSLHYTMSSNGGKDWSDAEPITPENREYCWHSFAHGAEHTYLLYHATDPGGLAMSIQKRGEPWQVGGPVDAFTWKMNDCPYTGGDLAVEQTTSRRLHALIWTNQDEHAGVHHLIRNSSDDSWQAAGRLGNQNARNAHLAAAADGRFLATWDEGGVVYAAWSRKDKFGKPIRLSGNTQHASHPQAATTLDNGYVFWRGESGHSGSTWFMRHVEQSS